MRHLILPTLVTLCLAPPAYAQIDFRSPRAAGKVWEKKVIENNPKARNQSAEADAADAAWEKPLTAAELQGTLARNRDEYDRRVKRYGQGHTDRWLDRVARSERFERSGNARPRANSVSDTAKRSIRRYQPSKGFIQTILRLNGICLTPPRTKLRRRGLDGAREADRRETVELLEKYVAAAFRRGGVMTRRAACTRACKLDDQSSDERRSR